MSRVLKTGDNQVTYAYGKKGHGGIDIVKKMNRLDYIVAHSAGTVVFVQKGYGNNKSLSGTASYGNCVKIKHNNGYYSLYAHLDKVYVDKNDYVENGETIGYMGNTGRSYGAHLHFEIRDEDNKRVDPTGYIDANLPNSNEVETVFSTAIGDEVYIVKSGDTLIKIAKEYDMNYKELAELNNINDPSKISVGQKLIVEKADEFETGRYEVTAEVLNVREGPDVNYDKFMFDELSENAQEQILSLYGKEANGYVKGMVCDVYEVAGNFGRTKSGYISLKYCKKV